MPDRCHHHHDCLEELAADHQQILAQLADLEIVIGESSLNQEKIKNFLHFTETFAEPHHQKEEQILFPLLEKRGIPNEGGPIGMMLIEHTAKKDYIKQIREALQENNWTKLQTSARFMISLLRDHINKEDNILYPCARDVLSEEELAELGPRCEAIQKSVKLA